MLCSESVDIGGRDDCASDYRCMQKARKLCDETPNCFGIAWFASQTATEPLKINVQMCKSRTISDNPGWRTIFKGVYHIFYGTMCYLEVQV